MKETKLQIEPKVEIEWERRVKERVAKKRITVQLRNVVHVAGVYSEDLSEIRPAYLWGIFDAPDDSVDDVTAFRYINPSLAPEDLTPEVLADRTWRADGSTRFKQYEVRLNNNITGGDQVAKSLRFMGLEPTEEMVRQFQHDREAALRSFDDGWIAARITQMRAEQAERT